MTITAADVADAIVNLASELARGVDPALCLTDVAAEYGMREDVLLARFERQHGVAPAAYPALLVRRAADAERAEEVAARQAARDAERERSDRIAIAEFVRDKLLRIDNARGGLTRAQSRVLRAADAYLGAVA